MPTVVRTFTIDAHPASVVDYLKDFAHTEEWDPGTRRCTRNDTGPIVEGASWHNVSRIFGMPVDLTYTLTALTESSLVFVGDNMWATSVDTITVEADDRGSRLTYHADLTMKGVGKLVDPMMKLVFEKIASDTETQMSAVLNRLSTKETR